MNQKKIHNLGKRTITRLIAIQVFYQFDFYEQKKSLTEIKENTIEEYSITGEENPTSYENKVDLNLLNSLLEGVLMNQKPIDGDISEFLRSGWKIETISSIALQILRFATMEIKFFHETHFKIIIKEYLEIANYFFENSRISFINSVLEQIVKKYRIEEFLKNKNQ